VRTILFFSVIFFASSCSNSFFYPKKELYDTSYLSGLYVSEVSVASADNVTLWGLLVRDRPDPRATIVFFHGNAENVTSHLRSMTWLVREGYQVLAVDYRGYGKSGGEPTIEGVNADAEAILNFAFNCPQIDPGRVAVLGQSLGGALAIRAVAASPHGGKVKLLVSESAFFGYREIVSDKIASTVILWPLSRPLAMTVEDQYSPGLWIGQLPGVHVLLIHSQSDNVVPYEHGEKLFSAAKEPKGFWTVRNPGHVNGFSLPDLRENLLKVLAERLGGERN
jgi:hypothetical protein